MLDKERYSQEENGPVQMKPDKIHLYVVHPVLVDPPLGGLPARPTKVFLTKKVRLRKLWEIVDNLSYSHTLADRANRPCLW